MKTPRPARTTRTIALPQELDDALVGIATTEARTVSNLVCYYLRNAVARQNTTKKYNSGVADNLRETRAIERRAKASAVK